MSATVQDIKIDELCNSILRISKNIQSVAIINKLGRPIEKVTRDDGLKQLPQPKEEMFFMQCVLEISMGKDYDSEYGPINYHLSERENLTMITFPMRDHVVLVTTKKDTVPISLAKKIVTTINGYQTS
ncbi:MAG: hypothetical protein HY223_04300 [Thaumarchaeota archaeon]|nr:hypothetical protein [Nitrososphaerota archaeon]